jgi:MFS family permease
VVPFLARSVGMSTSELGMVTAAAATARIVSNVPAALAAERFGRRPLLVAGPLLVRGRRRALLGGRARTGANGVPASRPDNIHAALSLVLAVARAPLACW